MDNEVAPSASAAGVGGPAASAARRAVSSSSPSEVGFGGMRRQSTSERINEILEGALARAERSEMSRSPSTYSPNARSPHLSRNQSSVQGPMGGLAEHDGEYDDLEDMARTPPPDETTGIIMRGAGGGGGAREINYQSTMSDGVRSRRRLELASGRDSGESEAARPRGDGPPQVDGALESSRPVARVSEKRWYERVIEPFRSIELENKGSVARDHLAIERTFLAWLRTSLAFASIGIAVTQLFRLNTSLQDTSPGNPNRNNGGAGLDSRLRTLRQLGKPLGATFLGISILILFLGYRRYTHAQHWVMHGKFPASRGTILLVSFATFAVTVASLVVVVAVHPTKKEP